MAMWKNDDEMFALMKEKLYTPVVGDILDQMGYKHQFLPASIRPLAAQVPTAPYILPGEEEDKRLKVAGYACTVGRAAHRLRQGPRCSWRRSGRLHPRYPQGYRAELPCFLLRYMGTGFLRPYLRVQVALPH